MSVVERTSPREHVAQVTLSRPESLNSLNAELVEQLHAELDAVAADPTVRAVVLTGSGRGFCSGLDLKGFGKLPGAEAFGGMQRGVFMQERIASLVTKLRAVPQPVIAAVNGPASGGGFGLVLGADIRIAAASATFSAPFVRIGLSACDVGISWLLPRIIGTARAHEMMLTARPVDADEALRIGMVSRVVADDQLLDTALSLASDIVASAPFGVRMTKAAMWSAVEAPTLQMAIEVENRQQIMATTTNDFREARAAFVERRQPVFTNS